MNVFKCKMCGGDLRADKQAAIGFCEYCGSKMTLPKVNDERIANLFNRANHYRKSSEFDKAMASFENILNEDDSIAEAHWGIVLCKYGIEYVTDPVTSEMIPTCHRTQFLSVLSDADYIATLKFSDNSAKILYEKEAQHIERIQRKAIEITQKESPYDAFICYKESDDLGNRTEDSVLAQDIYTYLLNEGFKVFYSRITLRAHTGEEYEPYIFSALNSSKVMIVVGTKTEFLNAVWVKNEWSRFLALMKNNKGKVMLPCYKGLNPYDLPEEFVHLQAYNIDTNTFMLDLTKTIKNSVQKKQEYSKKDYSQSDIASAMTNETAAASLKRADIFLSNHDFENALAYYSKCLDTNPECSLAYWGQLAVKLKCITDDDMIALGKPVFDFVEYKNAIRFAAENEKTKYSRVTEGIQQKITDTISQLKAHELFEVRQTNIETELSNCETSIIADEEFINEKLDELLKIEQQLKVVAEECINLVSAEKNSIAEMSIEIQHKLDSHKSEIPTLDKDQTSRWIAQSQQMIKTQYEKFCHTKDVSPEFKEYQELRARQNQLNNVLNTAVQKVQRYNQSLFSTCQKVQKINSIYSEVYTEVKKGVYTNANTLLEKSIT